VSTLSVDAPQLAYRAAGRPRAVQGADAPFNLDWVWDGKPASSRAAMDETGYAAAYLQATACRSWHTFGTISNNAIQSWWCR